MAILEIMMLDCFDLNTGEYIFKTFDFYYKY